MTPREIAKWILFEDGRFTANDEIINLTEKAILADRQALQSKLMAKIEAAKVSGDTYFDMGIETATAIVQSVFAQQSQPEESKPSELRAEIAFQREVARNIHMHYQKEIENLKSESDRRVLAEREACILIVKRTVANSDEVSDIEREIRARSNQPEGKSNNHPIDPGVLFNELSPNLNRLDQSARIAALQEWLATDAKIIQQLNQSNQKLAEENRELRKRMEADFMTPEQIAGNFTLPEDTQKLLAFWIKQSILAEREACAKICDDYYSFKESEARSKGNWLIAGQEIAHSSQEIASQIRARFNAPESPNKPQIGFFGLDLSSGKTKEEKIDPDPISA